MVRLPLHLPQTFVFSAVCLSHADLVEHNSHLLVFWNCSILHKRCPQLFPSLGAHLCLLFVEAYQMSSARPVDAAASTAHVTLSVVGGMWKRPRAPCCRGVWIVARDALEMHIKYNVRSLNTFLLSCSSPRQWTLHMNVYGCFDSNLIPEFLNWWLIAHRDCSFLPRSALFFLPWIKNCFSSLFVWIILQTD